MSDYTVSQIRPDDRRAVKQMEELLNREGIQRDQNLDYSIGLYDEAYNLAATGSCFQNTLRCMAVASEHQGEGLMNQVVSLLEEYQLSRGNRDLFLYTKTDTARFFRDLGFYEIARAEGKVVFMENRKNGFQTYLEALKQETAAAGFSFASASGAPTGAVIMNANPFTLGHLYLLEQAAARCRLLHVFVVSEELSLVPYSVRRRLVEAGSAHIKNRVCHQTGSYMISSATFPSYFLKDSETVIRSHARLDIQIFTQISKALGITCRFVGEEPFSQVTGIYNQVMEEELKRAGISLTILPRKADQDGAISASQVRRLIQTGHLDQIRSKVPPSTWEYFSSPQAKPVIQRIQQARNVIHY